MTWFLVGYLLGGLIGLFLASLLAAAKVTDLEDDCRALAEALGRYKRWRLGQERLGLADLAEIDELAQRWAR